MKKSILALLLAVLMVASLLPAAAMADGEVAEVGNAKYTSLQEAINHASGDNNVVVLIADVTESVTIESGDDIILDLGTHKITNVAGRDTITVALGGTLEIRGTGTVDNVSHGKAAIFNNGTTTLYGGAFTRSKENGISSSDNGGNSFYVLLNHGNMTIYNGVSVTQSGHYSSMVENGYQNYNSQYNRNENHANPELVIEGGNFSGGLNTIKNDDGGILEINGGVFENVSQSAVMNWNDATINDGWFMVTGGGSNALVNSYANDTVDKGTLEINGGYYSCSGALIGIGQEATNGGNTVITDGIFEYGEDANLFVSNTATANVTGGEFNNTVAAKYLGDTLQYQVNNNGTYTYYTTFDAALAAAQNGAEIVKVAEGVGAQHYTITIDPANGGTVLSYKLPSGSPYTLPTVTKSGYAFLGWSDGLNTYPAGTVITLTSNVTYTASWVRHPDTPYVPEPEEPEEPEVPEFPFYDVPTSAWYYTAVKYVYDNKLMDGVDTYVFAPNDTLTRAMVWTIIARMSGVDTTGGNTWYAKAQEWVITNGISDGENPTAAITREEFVTMLWRLAGEPIYTGDLSRVPDAGSISTWAQNAMLWSYATGLTEGDENGALTPLATATRAQAAAMIMRFCESVK